MSISSDVNGSGLIREVSRSESGVAFEWTPIFYSSSNRLNECCTSPEIRAMANTWFLSLYPNGNKEDHRDWICLFLCKRGRQARDVRFTIGVKLAGQTETEIVSKRRFPQKFPKFRIFRVLPKSSLLKGGSKVNLTGQLTVTCQLWTGEQPILEAGDGADHEPLADDALSPVSAPFPIPPANAPSTTPTRPAATDSNINRKRKAIAVNDVNECAMKYPQDKQKLLKNKDMPKPLELDPDTAFLQSLLPDIKAMTAQQKRKFKIGILNFSSQIIEQKASNSSSLTSDSLPDSRVILTTDTCMSTSSSPTYVTSSTRYGNCRTLNDFERLATISEGTFGVLYKCKDKRTNEIYALKKFKMPADLQDGIPSSILREINILNTLKHVNLVNSHGTVAGRNLENNYIILDYCVCSLKDLIERNVETIYNKAMVKFLMRQLFHGLEYIHGGLIIHRDICSKNIIFNGQGILKIGGFRASRFYSKGNLTPSVTELDYRAPELLFQAKLYGPAVDMWSAGCIFAQLLLKKLLFSGSSEMEMIKSIFDVLGTPSENIWPGFGELFRQMETGDRTLEMENEKPHSDLNNFFDAETAACKDLIQDLLIYFPNARLSAQECLRSHYFTESPQASKHEDLALVLRNMMHGAGPSEVNN